MFEEFVKLAIERQRWEQAQDVTKIIQSTLKKPDYYSDYYDYDYPDFDDERPNKRPSQRPRRPFRNRFNRPRFEDYYQDEESENEKWSSFFVIKI